MRRALIAACLCAGCGEETALLVETDLTAFRVPEEVNLLYLELSNDEDGLLLSERFEVPVGETRPVVRLRPGERFPRRFLVTAFAYLDEYLVASSEAQPIRFADGDTQRVRLEVARAQ